MGLTPHCCAIAVSEGKRLLGDNSPLSTAARTEDAINFQRILEAGSVMALVRQICGFQL
jgi:hypothetical protein